MRLIAWGTQQRWHAITCLSAFFVPALSVAVPDGYSIGALILLLGALLALPQWWGRPLEPRVAWMLVLSFLCMAVIWQIDGLRSHAGWPSTDKPVKYLLIVPCLFFVLMFPPRQEFLWAGIAMGAVGGGLVAIYQCVWLGLPRAEGSINAIQFGNLSLLLGLLCVVGLLLWRPPEFERIWRALFAGGASFGVLGSLLSQSRGGWLALLVVGPVLAWILWRNLGRRKFVLSCVSVMLVGGVLLSLMAPKLDHRIDLVTQEIELYETTGNAATSVGQRLEQWGLAWRLGMEHPVIGWSQQGCEDQKAIAVAKGLLHPSVMEYDHAHNELLDVFMKRGVLGVVTLLGLYIVPIVIFWPRTGSASNTVGLRTIGVLIPVAYIGFGLTQVFLGHNSGTMFFLFMTVLTLGALKHELHALPSCRGHEFTEARTMAESRSASA